MIDLFSKFIFNHHFSLGLGAQINLSYKNISKWCFSHSVTLSLNEHKLNNTDYQTTFAHFETTGGYVLILVKIPDGLKMSHIHRTSPE